MDLNKRCAGIKALELRLLYVTTSRVNFLSNIGVMPCRATTTMTNNETFLDSLAVRKQSEGFQVWMKSIHADRLLRMLRSKGI